MPGEEPEQSRSMVWRRRLTPVRKWYARHWKWTPQHSLGVWHPLKKKQSNNTYSKKKVNSIKMAVQIISQKCMAFYQKDKLTDFTHACTFSLFFLFVMWKGFYSQFSQYITMPIHVVRHMPSSKQLYKMCFCSLVLIVSTGLILKCSSITNDRNWTQLNEPLFGLKAVLLFHI